MTIQAMTDFYNLCEATEALQNSSRKKRKHNEARAGLDFIPSVEEGYEEGGTTEHKTPVYMTKMTMNATQMMTMMVTSASIRTSMPGLKKTLELVKTSLFLCLRQQ